jgi:hypothetical protein
VEAAALLVAVLAAVERGELTAPQPMISHLAGGSCRAAGDRPEPLLDRLLHKTSSNG